MGMKTALPFVGDAVQGAIYGYEGGSVGRGIAAGLGSLAGRAVGAAGGALTAPVTGPVGPIAGEIGGSMAGAYGAAKLYDMATGADQRMPASVQQALANLDNRAVPSRIDMPQGLTANTGGAGDAMRIDAPAPGSTTPQITRQTPAESGKYEIPSAAVSEPKAPAKPQGFQPPTAEELARFKKETGTAFSSQSINDKLSLERMRAGEETFDTKQANAYRKANPNYRPGQYVKGYNPNASPKSPSIEQFRQRDRELRGLAQQRESATTPAFAASAPNRMPSLEQRGIARTLGSSDPLSANGFVKNTEPRPSRQQSADAVKNAYYARYRASRS